MASHNFDPLYPVNCSKFAPRSTYSKASVPLGVGLGQRSSQNSGRLESLHPVETFDAASADVEIFFTGADCGPHGSDAPVPVFREHNVGFGAFSFKKLSMGRSSCNSSSVPPHCDGATPSFCQNGHLVDKSTLYSRKYVLFVSPRCFSIL